jgi:putative FmdB family regulatory protein
MPIYEYRCKKGHTFEVMQRMSDDPVTTCEVCGAPVERVFHPIAVHFKGSGFYNTDYGTRKRSREMKESKDGTGSNGAKESTKESTTSTKSDSGGSDSSASKSDSGSSSAKKSETKT